MLPSAYPCRIGERQRLARPTIWGDTSSWSQAANSQIPTLASSPKRSPHGMRRCWKRSCRLRLPYARDYAARLATTVARPSLPAGVISTRPQRPLRSAGPYPPTSHPWWTDKRGPVTASAWPSKRECTWESGSVPLVRSSSTPVPVDHKTAAADEQRRGPPFSCSARSSKHDRVLAQGSTKTPATNDQPRIRS